MTTKRRCANWLHTYRDYILPRTDAPESYVFWSGIFTLACAVRRKVWIPKQYLGLWDCYPFVYLMFIGPPGVRKTTTIKSGSEVLLSQVPDLQAGPSVFTKEAVIDRMNVSSDNSLYMSIGEFSDIFQKAGKDRPGMYEFLTSMYDGSLTYDAATKTQGTAFLDKPCLNFFSATTPGWITENMPEGVISGGFASRVMFVYEEMPRTNKMFFDDVKYPYPDNTSISFLDLERDLLLDLAHIAKEMAGEFQFSDEGLEYAREWSTQEPPMWLKKNDKLGGYLNRKKTFVAKLAQIHSISTKDELIITGDDWAWAVNAIESTEQGLTKIFSGVGKNRYITEVDKIIAFVKNMNFFSMAAVPRWQILQNFGHSAEPRMLNELLTYAVDSKYLLMKPEGDDYVFWVPEFAEQKLLSGV